MSVSAIIPTFNRLRYIRRAIDSVLAQTVPVDELIVVDDGSTDGTADALKAEYGSRIRVIRQSNKGVSLARWRGVQEARGEWIEFLDSDDEWTPNHNKDLLDSASKVPEDVAWILGNHRYVCDDADLAIMCEHAQKRFSLLAAGEFRIFADSLNVVGIIVGLIPLQTSVIRRSVLLELDCFHEGVRIRSDLLAAYQVACRYRFAAIGSVVTVCYRSADLAQGSVSAYYRIRGTARSSIAYAGFVSADHFRARMMAFAAVIKSGRRRPWNRLYAAEVIALCKALADRGEHVPRKLALRQFRYGAISAKGIAFFCATMFGRRGIQAWNRMAAFRRNPAGIGWPQSLKKNSARPRKSAARLGKFLP